MKPTVAEQLKQFVRVLQGGETELPQRLHDALIAATQAERLVGHISRDSTEIEAAKAYAHAGCGSACQAGPQAGKAEG